jgi:hypothetical protein
MRTYPCCMKCRAIPGACGRKWVCACHMTKKKEQDTPSTLERYLFGETRKERTA